MAIGLSLHDPTKLRARSLRVEGVSNGTYGILAGESMGTDNDRASHGGLSAVERAAMQPTLGHGRSASPWLFNMH